MNLKLVAIDLAKRSFQLCGISTAGKVLFNHKVSRVQLLKRLTELPPTTVAMEATPVAPLAVGLQSRAQAFHEDAIVRREAGWRHAGGENSE